MRNRKRIIMSSINSTATLDADRQGSGSRIAYDINDAAAHTAVDAGRIALAIRDRELPAYRIGGQAVLLPEDIRTWVKSHPRF